MNNIATTPFNDGKLVVGKGYIYLPEEIDRSQYVQQSLQNGKVSILTEDSGVISEVFVSKICLPFLEFPPKVGELGSFIIYVTEQLQKQPIIVGILDKAGFTSLSENEWVLKKSSQGSIVEISGNPNNCLLHQNVTSKSSQSPTLLTTVGGNDLHNSQHSLEVDGSITEKSIEHTIESSKFEVQTKDEDSESFISQTSEEIDIQAPKIRLNGGSNSAVLGNELAKFLFNFVDELGSITIHTAIGQMPIINKEKVLEFKEIVEDFLSKTVYVD